MLILYVLHISLPRKKLKYKKIITFYNITVFIVFLSNKCILSEHVFFYKTSYDPKRLNIILYFFFLLLNGKKTKAAFKHKS